MSKIPAELSGLYLEDSYFLGVVASGATLRVRGLFALTRDHAAYTPPLPGEQHCYREGDITLSLVRVTSWTAGKPSLLSDPDGSLDLGGIEFWDSEGGYRIITEWFDMSCRCDALCVTLD